MKMTDYLAIYAAILSTTIFVWNIYQTRARISVDLIFGLSDENLSIDHVGLYVYIRNKSSHKVNIANISILYQIGDHGWKAKLSHFKEFKSWSKSVGWCWANLSSYNLGNEYPCILEPRSSHQVFIPETIVKKLLLESKGDSLMAVVQDQLWLNFYSKPYQWHSK